MRKDSSVRGRAKRNRGVERGKKWMGSTRKNRGEQPRGGEGGRERGIERERERARGGRWAGACGCL